MIVTNRLVLFKHLKIHDHAAAEGKPSDAAADFTIGGHL